MIVIQSPALRKTLRWALPCLVFPALVLLGAGLANRGQYALVILLAVLAAFLLFVTGFEKKKTGARRMAVVSVMVALSVAGRFIPLFKPVAALTILTGMYLGGEAGFLAGALSAVVSNFYFGQGPWTPFQMLAWGLIGLIAGYLAEPLKRSRFFLLTYGVLAGVAYSLIMDVWSVMWYGGGFHWALYLAAIISALPYTLLYSISNFLFLYFFARPFGEKLQRVKIKYGV